MDGIDKLQKDENSNIECPYSKKTIIDKKNIIKRFYDEKKYDNKEIYETVKQYAFSTYGEDIDEIPLETDFT